MSNPGAIVPTRSCRAQEDFDFAAQWYYRSRRHAAGTVFIFLQMLETSRDTAQQVLQDLDSIDLTAVALLHAYEAQSVGIATFQEMEDLHRAKNQFDFLLHELGKAQRAQTQALCAYFPPEIAHMIASYNNRPLSEEEYLS